MCVYMRRHTRHDSSTWLLHTRHVTLWRMRHDTFTCVYENTHMTWLIHIWDMARSHVTHDSSTWEPWLIHVCERREHVRQDSFTDTWLINMRDMTHLRVWERRAYTMWLLYMWHMTHSHMRHDSFAYETWLIHIWDMTHSHVTHLQMRPGSLMCVCETHVCVSDKHTRHFDSHDLIRCVTWHDSGGFGGGGGGVTHDISRDISFSRAK